MKAEARASPARHGPRHLARQLIGAAAVAAALLVTACSGTQGIPDQLRLNPGPGTEAQNSLLPRQAATGSQGGGAQATPPPSNGQNVSAFCRDIIDQLSRLPNLFNATSPEDLKAQLDRIRVRNPRLLLEAPPSIRPSLQTVIRFEDRIYADATSNPQDIANAVASSTFQTAFQRVQLYAAETCGVRGAPDTTPTT
jgi:hypothetical protein